MKSDEPLIECEANDVSRRELCEIESRQMKRDALGGLDFATDIDETRPSVNVAY